MKIENNLERFHIYASDWLRLFGRADSHASLGDLLSMANQSVKLVEGLSIEEAHTWQITFREASNARHVALSERKVLSPTEN